MFSQCFSGLSPGTPLCGQSRNKTELVCVCVCVPWRTADLSRLFISYRDMTIFIFLLLILHLTSETC